MVSIRTLVLTSGAVGVLAAGLGGYAALRPHDGERQRVDRVAARAAAVPPAEIGAPVPEPGRVPAGPERIPAATPQRESRRSAPTSERASTPAAPDAPAPPAIEAGVPASAPPPALPAASSAFEAPPPPPPVQAGASRPAEPPRFDELSVAADSVIGIRLDTPVSSETARLEDRVVARVTRDVMVDGRTAIPAGARLEGVVSLVESGGKFKERAQVGIRFTQLVLGETNRIAIQTEAIHRGGDAPAPEAAAKIGAGAANGAMLGAVIGGKKGAAIGAGAGAAGGTAVVAKGSRNEAVLVEGSPLTVRLTAPVKVLVERSGG